MRKLAIMAALATTALATPAMARDGAWYVGVEGGAMIVEDIDYDVTSTAGVLANNAVSADHEYGWDVDGIIGYDFGMFRLEGEIGYKQAFIDTFNTTIALPAGFGPTSPAGSYDEFADGKTSALSFMLNGLVDFGADDGLQGFIGGGVGIARVKADNYQLLNNGTAFLDDSDSKFAWQILAGVRAPLTDSIDVGIKYRYFNVDDIKLVAADGSAVKGKFRSHSLLGSLIFNFGEPAAPPPPRPRRPRRRRRRSLLRRRRRRLSRVRSSCSSTGISRTSRRKPLASSTTPLRLMPRVVRLR